MWWQVLQIIFPVFACVSVGWAWRRAGGHYDTAMVSALVMNVAAPCLVVSTLGSVSLAFATLVEIALVFAAVFGLTLLASWLLLRLMRRDVRGFLTALVFPNVGNMGLPLCLLAFGERGLALALGWFMLNSVLHFSLGVSWVSGARPGKQWLTNPIVVSVLVALVMVWQDWQLPGMFQQTLSLIGAMTIPLMLITLGVTLATLRVTHLRDAVVLSFARLGIGLVAALLVLQLVPVEPALAGVVMLQSSMPVAVFNYLFAERYQRHPQQLAGMVVVSTLMAFALLPFLLGYLLA